MTTPAEATPDAIGDRERATASLKATPAQRRLRITEVMSNPPESGADGDHEWVELMNTGQTPASLAGISLRDRRMGNVLPPYTVDAGAVVVIAAPGVLVPEGVPLIRLRRAIGNGLGNAGDRIVLVAADGREIDAAAYGEDVEDGEQPLPAPGPGQSIERRFSAVGTLLEARLTDAPTPCIAPGTSPTTTESRNTTTTAADALARIEGLAPAWVVLGALAGGLLLIAGAARAASVVRRGDSES